MTIEQFLQERVYLKGISDKTLISYQCGFKAFAGATNSKQEVIDRIKVLKERGLSNVSINTYIRHINAYFNWLHIEFNQPKLKIPQLKEEQKIIPTMSEDMVTAFLAFKPVGVNAKRAHLVGITILDTGLRIAETLSLTKEDIDFDNLTVKVKGKGGRHRLIPMSAELRKRLFRFIVKAQSSSMGTKGYIFGTKNNTKLSIRNFHRDFQELGEELGVSGLRWSAHTLRHTFAVLYLRRGGNLEFLRRILGHSSISTTQKYLRSLGITDLRNVHDGLSPLGH